MINKRVKFLVFSASYPYRGGISDSTHSLCNELIKNSGFKLLTLKEVLIQFKGLMVFIKRLITKL